MKKAKINNNTKKIKEEEVQTESFTVKNIIIVLVTMLVIFVGFYFLTDFLLSKQTTTKNETEEAKENNVITFNNILNQANKTYYVLAIIPGDKNASKYNIYTDTLTPVYTIDMNDAFNKSHIGDETVISDSVKDIVISDSTLFIVTDGKIVENYTGFDNIKAYVVSTFKTNEIEE